MVGGVTVSYALHKIMGTNDCEICSAIRHSMQSVCSNQSGKHLYIPVALFLLVPKIIMLVREKIL